MSGRGWGVVMYRTEENEWHQRTQSTQQARMVTAELYSQTPWALELLQNLPVPSTDSDSQVRTTLNKSPYLNSRCQKTLGLVWRPQILAQCIAMGKTLNVCRCQITHMTEL